MVYNATFSMKGEGLLKTVVQNVTSEVGKLFAE
jgi:hypothetical protein